MSPKGILLVDDEEIALKYFSKAFSGRFQIHVAASASQALKVLEEHHHSIGVVVTDQRMPEATGVELLKIVRQRYPWTVRILTTGYSDLATLVDAINAGAVYSFVSKPWELEELGQTLDDALVHHQTQTDNATLLESTLAELRERILEDRTFDLGLISAKLGHYVHNALCPISLLIDHFVEERQGEAAALSVEFLESIRGHIRDVSRTLKGLSGIADAPEDADFQLVDLPQLLQAAMERSRVLQQQKALRFEAEIEESLPAVRAVPLLMERFFSFMIAEEIVSLPQGSEVRVRLRSGSGDGVTIEFEDFEPIHGEATSEGLLHPFNVRGSNPRDFGIFLISCYFIARHHGGRLGVRVKPEGGVLFSLALPGSSAGSRTVADRLLRKKLPKT